MTEEDKNKIRAYSKKTPKYLSRRKFNEEGALGDVQCSHCKKFKSISEFSKNKTQIDGLETKCKVCKQAK